MNSEERRRVSELQSALIDAMSKILSFDDDESSHVITTSDVRNVKFRTRTTPFAEWYNAEDVDRVLDDVIKTIYLLNKTNAKLRMKLDRAGEKS